MPHSQAEADVERDGRHRHMVEAAAHYLALQVRLLRTSRKMTVAALARRAHVAKHLIVKIEAGRIFEDDDVTTEHMSRIATVFDVAFMAQFVPFSTFTPPTYPQEKSSADTR